MKYQKVGKKYVLLENYTYKYNFSKHNWTNPYLIKLNLNSIVLGKGFMWDGPSGLFTIHTKNFMRGSLVHDALYTLISLGILPKSFRKKADKILRNICLEDGMSRFRAWYVYKSVRIFGGRHV